MTMDETARQQVFRALDNAVENGYEEFLKKPADEVAADLADCDADLESLDLGVLEELVRDWQMRNA